MPRNKDLTNAERVIAAIKGKRIRSITELAAALGVSRPTAYTYLGQAAAAGYEINNGRLLSRWTVAREPSEAERYAHGEAMSAPKDRGRRRA